MLAKVDEIIAPEAVQYLYGSRSRFPFLFLLLHWWATLGPQAPAFDGKWVVDKSKTQAVGAPEDLQIEIKQDGPKLESNRSIESRKRGVSAAMGRNHDDDLELTTDGTEKVNQIGPFAHNSKTQIDGNKMTTEFIASDEGEEGRWPVDTTRFPRWKEMTLQVLSNASDGRKLDQTLVFRRK